MVKAKRYHQLNKTIPFGKNPRENEVRHPEVTHLVSYKDLKQQKKEGPSIFRPS